MGINRTYTDLITICIPVYERYEYFEEAIESAINQTIKCKVIVVDNASSHNNFERYVNNKGLDNLIYHRNSENVGMVDNWNECVNLAETEWVTLLHDDDVIDIRFIEFMTPILSKNKDRIAYAVSCTKGPICDVNEFKLETNKPSYILDKLFFMEGVLPPPGLVFNKNIAIELNGFDPCDYPIHDYVFYYKLLQNRRNIPTSTT